MWISVKDRMPEEEFSRVLVVVPPWNHFRPVAIAIREDGTWQVEDGSGLNTMDDDEITHWMPIPSPPVTEGETK